MSGLSIKFYQHPKRVKGDRHQIFIRLIMDRKKAELATNYHCPISEWDREKERFKKNDTLNSELSLAESQIREIKQRLQYEQKFISSKVIKDVYLGKDTIDTYLLIKYKEYLNGLEGKSLAKSTISTYWKTHNHVEGYIKSLGTVDVNVKEIDLEFIENLDSYFYSQPGLNGAEIRMNTVNKHHSRFRSYLLYLKRHKLIKENPYEHFELRFEESERTFLTREELEDFSTCSLGDNKSLDRARDVFLFSVYTGLRFGDAQKMRMDNLIKVGDKWYFQHLVQKSHKHTRIPLLPPALEILKKYDLSPDRSMGRILPKLSNQKVNTYLKVIAELAGIEKNVSHHVARHSCATTILLENQVPLEVVQAWLNHSSLKETMIYAKLTNRVVNEAVSVEELFAKLK